jgi:hypothetical protein
MAATIRTGSIHRTTGLDGFGHQVGYFYPLTAEEAIDLAFTMDAEIDKLMRKANTKGIV